MILGRVTILDHSCTLQILWFLPVLYAASNQSLETGLTGDLDTKRGKPNLFFFGKPRDFYHRAHARHDVNVNIAVRSIVLMSPARKN